MADQKLIKVSNFLSSLHFHFQKNWLRECIDYYENDNPNISEEELKREVKQQWLLLNLRDMKIGVFPPNLNTQSKVVLDGSYAVQVETLIDSGQSRFSQLQVVRKDVWENVKATSKPEENELSSRRCITMTITDGVQELYAMEYELIPSLKLNNPDLLPGFKAVIKGPVICRKGMLLLGPSNITICGGEVDTLIESNSYEKLLLRSLGHDDASISLHLTNKKSPVKNNSNIQRTLSERDDVLMDVELFDDEPFEHFNVPSEPADNIFERTSNGINSVPQRNVEALEDFVDDHDIFLNLVHEREFLNVSPAPSRSHGKIVQSTINQFLIPDQAENNVIRKCLVLNREPFVYLDQIVKTPLTKDCIIKVKAIIITLKTKIAVQGDQFSLQAKISDGSLNIDAMFSSNVLENLLGFSPCELSSLMREKNKNTAISERLRSAFSHAQEQLISLNCLLDIKFSASLELPCILSLNEITGNDLENLKIRSRN